MMLLLLSPVGCLLVTNKLASNNFPTLTLRTRTRRCSGVGTVAFGFLGNFPRMESCGRKNGSLNGKFVRVFSLEQESVGSEHLDDNGVKTANKGKANIPEVVSRLHGAKTAEDVEEVLKDVDGLRLKMCSTIIKGLGSDNQLDAAFAVVEYLKKRSSNGGHRSLAPNLFIYNSLLSAVKQARCFEQVERVLEDMTLQGVVPNIVTYNCVMSVYVQQGKIQEALNILAEVERRGLTLSPITYLTVLCAYQKKHDAFSAIEYFSKFREGYQNGEIGKDQSGEYKWDEEFRKVERFTIRICYEVMRQYLLKEEDPTSSVLKLLSTMDFARVKPDRTDYERLVWACTSEVHYTVAKELYQRIRESDGERSLTVCNHLIWLMGKAKKWWAALEVYEDMLDKGPKPNDMSNHLIMSHFDILLKAARRKGMWRWGVRLLNKMQEKGLRPGSKEWNAVLVASSKAAETSAAVAIFKRMVEQGEKPNVVSYGALLSALEKGKLYEEALKVWDHMGKIGVEPNLHAYTILASIYVGKGNLEMVDYVLREMDSSSIEPTVVTFNAIIAGCAKNNLCGAALEWFHRMKVRNIEPNEITFEMLIEALARDGDPRLAYEMYLKACNDGLQLSGKSFDTVTGACQTYDANTDLSALGPRPADKKKTVDLRKNISSFCNFAGIPKTAAPFDRAEIYT